MNKRKILKKLYDKYKYYACNGQDTNRSFIISQLYLSLYAIIKNDKESMKSIKQSIDSFCNDLRGV